MKSCYQQSMGRLEGLVFDQLEIRELSSGNNREFRLADLGQPLLYNLRVLSSLSLISASVKVGIKCCYLYFIRKAKINEIDVLYVKVFLFSY